MGVGVVVMGGRGGMIVLNILTQPASESSRPSCRLLYSYYYHHYHFSLFSSLGHFLSVLLLLLSLVIFSSFPSLRCGRITMHKNLASLQCCVTWCWLFIIHVMLEHIFFDRPCPSFSPLPLGWPTIPLSTLTALIFPSKGL